MRERYVKSGVSVRCERNAAEDVVVETSEQGIAEMEGHYFSCWPCETDLSVTAVDRAAVVAMSREIDASIPSPLLIERFALVDGWATHRILRGGEYREWKERTARLFLSLAHPNLGARTTIHLGDSDLDALDLGAIVSGASAFSRAEHRRNLPPPGRVRLAPAVSAALWPALIGASLEASYDVTLTQTMHPDFVCDGMGQVIQPIKLSARGKEWPNFFRPSYRVRPQRAPFHLTAEGAPLGEVPEVTALMLLTPLYAREGSLVAELLCTDGQGSFPARVALAASEWMARIDGVSEERLWFPYEAGSYGCTADAEVALERIEA